MKRLSLVVLSLVILGTVVAVVTVKRHADVGSIASTKQAQITYTLQLQQGQGAIDHARSALNAATASRGSVTAQASQTRRTAFVRQGRIATRDVDTAQAAYDVRVISSWTRRTVA